MELEEVYHRLLISDSIPGRVFRVLFKYIQPISYVNLVYPRKIIGAVSSPANWLAILLMTLLLKNDGSRSLPAIQDGRNKALGFLGYSTQRPQ